MTALFVALGIAVLTLLALMLWFVPHLLHQESLRSAREAAELRDILLDMLSEQETLMLRQSQLSTSIASLQDQIEQIIGSVQHEEGRGTTDEATLRQIEERISAMQTQIQRWIDGRFRAQRNAQAHDNEAWAYLMSLLAAIQERVGQLSSERIGSAHPPQTRILLEELEQEMLNLHTISEDIATLQWRLRRSLNERETSQTALRSRASSGAD